MECKLRGRRQEGATDKKLTQIAERSINVKAQHA
jgi:hypothetical protein